MFWVKKRQLHVIRGYKKIGTEISFTLHSPLFFHSRLRHFHSPWGEPFTWLRSTALRHKCLCRSRQRKKRFNKQYSYSHCVTEGVWYS